MSKLTTPEIAAVIGCLILVPLIIAYIVAWIWALGYGLMLVFTGDPLRGLAILLAISIISVMTSISNGK